jgi:hypothetical protein
MSGAHTAVRNTVIAAPMIQIVWGAKGVPSKVAPISIRIIQNTAGTKDAIASPTSRMPTDPVVLRRATRLSLETTPGVIAAIVAHDRFLSDSASQQFGKPKKSKGRRAFSWKSA